MSGLAGKLHRETLNRPSRLVTLYAVLLNEAPPHKAMPLT